MQSSRVRYGLVALVVASLTGDVVCRSTVHSADEERLMRIASEGISRLPATIGPWRLLKTETMPDSAIALLQCRGHEARLYGDDQTGDKVSLILLVGPAGPLVAHTAEVCYGSVDNDIVGPPHSEIVRGTGERADTVHQVTFASKSLSGHKLRVYYAWRKFEGRWEAPDRPRLTLGGQPMLYKLQMAGEAPPKADDRTLESDAARRFLVDLLPVLDRTLDTK
jgi:hypothetical protein